MVPQSAALIMLTCLRPPQNIDPNPDQHHHVLTRWPSGPVWGHPQEGAALPRSMPGSAVPTPLAAPWGARGIWDPVRFSLVGSHTKGMLHKMGPGPCICSIHQPKPSKQT